MVMRRLKRIVLLTVLAFLLLVVSCNVWVVQSTRDRVFDDVDKLPQHRVALVLGTSHRLVGGGANPFFDERMKTAARIYRMGKIDHFILSGDN